MLEAWLLVRWEPVGGEGLGRGRSRLGTGDNGLLAV